MSYQSSPFASRARPGDKGFTPKAVLDSERHRLQSGATQISLTVASKPTHVGVDPQNTRIDRNSGDNVVAVE